jgi:hypothetical protein
MDPDPTPDPTHFFSDFKDAKNIIFRIFFFFLNRRHIIFGFENLGRFCVKILFCKHYFSPLITFIRKGKDPDPYLWLTAPDPGSPKIFGSGSPKFFRCEFYQHKVVIRAEQIGFSLLDFSSLQCFDLADNGMPFTYRH